MTSPYSIHPCAETDDGERYEVSPNEAAFGTLYRRGADGLALAVADLVGREDAEAVLRELEGLRPALSQIACMQKDGETGFEQTKDDAVDSLHSCIELARGALGIMKNEKEDGNGSD